MARLALSKFLLISILTLQSVGIVCAQSVDCKKTKTAAEQEICSDKDLGKLDEQLSEDFNKALADHPQQAAALASDERQWQRMRNIDCSRQNKDEDKKSCLNTQYQERLAAIHIFPQIIAPRPHTNFCRVLADQYRPLAKDHPGEAPIAVLTQLPNSKIRFGASPLQTNDQTALDTPSGDLVEWLSQWASRQKPSFSISAELQKALADYDGFPFETVLNHAPGTNFYTIESYIGTGHFYVSQSFIVRAGVAMPARTPSIGDSGPRYGWIEGKLAAIVENYDWGPGMSASLGIWEWDGQDFNAACGVDLTYKPRFRNETLNSWGEECKGEDCNELSKAAFTLAEAAETDVEALKAHSLEQLSNEQRQQFDAMEEAFKPQEREPTSNDPQSVPFIYRGHVYLASVGHFSIGWRNFADWA